MKKFARITIFGLFAFLAILVAVYAIFFLASPSSITQPKPLAESFRARP
jgi:hypothetical protein